MNRVNNLTILNYYNNDNINNNKQQLELLTCSNSVRVACTRLPLRPWCLIKIYNNVTNIIVISIYNIFVFLEGNEDVNW